jgi:D-arabinose 1-dehydrogenase-like Zn-dependent alcohol dehydrogenase
MHPPPAPPARPVWSTLAATTGAALVAWFPLSRFVDLEVTAGDSTRIVGGASVGISALVIALAALGFAAVVRRRVRRPRRVFTITGAVVLVLSLVSPLVQAVTTGAALSLLTLHVVVGAVVLGLVPRRLPSLRR